MKANNGSGNNISRDDWETPNWLFNLLNQQYEFGFDCCASKKNFKCYDYTSDFLNINGLNYSYCWMNPPFSKAKTMFEHFFCVVKHGVAIYRCDNLETSIWQRIIFEMADWIFIPDKRINYEGKKSTSSRFPSALIGVGVEPPKNIKGTILKVCL